jgi:hypothetical protein
MISGQPQKRIPENIGIFAKPGFTVNLGHPRYLPSGHLVYVTKGTLVAVPFDLHG